MNISDVLIQAALAEVIKELIKRGFSKLDPHPGPSSTETGQEKGRTQERLEMILASLNDKFGELPTATRSQVENLSLDRLRSLDKALSGFSSIDDLTNWLDPRQGV